MISSSVANDIKMRVPNLTFCYIYISFFIIITIKNFID